MVLQNNNMDFGIEKSDAPKSINEMLSGLAEKIEFLKERPGKMNEIGQRMIGAVKLMAENLQDGDPDKKEAAEAAEDLASQLGKLAGLDEAVHSSNDSVVKNQDVMKA